METEIASAIVDDGEAMNVTAAQMEKLLGVGLIYACQCCCIGALHIETGCSWAEIDAALLEVR